MGTAGFRCAGSHHSRLLLVVPRISVSHPPWAHPLFGNHINPGIKQQAECLFSKGLEEVGCEQRRGKKKTEQTGGGQARPQHEVSRLQSPQASNASATPRSSSQNLELT